MPEPTWGPDVVKLREQIHSLIRFGTTISILDIGCGYGDDLIRFGERCGADATFTGIDSARKPITKAREKTRNDPRFTFIPHDISGGLPFGDGSFDVVYSHNVLECIRDKEALISEVHRVLKPGGQVLFSHTDWDSQIINGTDKALIRRLVAAFSDWKQDWMSESDGWMGRRMAGLFRKNRGFSGEIIPFVLVNTEYAPGLYGYDRIRDVHTMAANGRIREKDYAAFQEDLEKTVSRGNYFYSVTLYVFSGTKIPADLNSTLPLRESP